MGRSPCSIDPMTWRQSSSIAVSSLSSCQLFWALYSNYHQRKSSSFQIQIKYQNILHVTLLPLNRKEFQFDFLCSLPTSVNSEPHCNSGFLLCWIHCIYPLTSCFWPCRLHPLDTSYLSAHFWARCLLPWLLHRLSSLLLFLRGTPVLSSFLEEVKELPFPSSPFRTQWVITTAY